jgi:hypothetical protein
MALGSYPPSPPGPRSVGTCRTAKLIQMVDQANHYDGDSKQRPERETPKAAGLADGHYLAVTERVRHHGDGTRSAADLDGSLSLPGRRPCRAEQDVRPLPR